MQIFKDIFQKTQDLAIPWIKKSRAEDKIQPWLSRKLLVTLKGKKSMCRQWKQEQITSEECRDEVQLCRDGIRKAKVKLKLNLARNVKDNKRASTSMLTRKGRSKEVNLLIKILLNWEQQKRKRLRYPAFFCLSLQWQPLFPYLFSGWTVARELQE